MTDRGLEKIAYLGPDGSNAHLAAMAVKKDHRYAEYGLLATKTITESLEAVLDKRCQLAVVPVENSRGGDVGETLNALVKLPGLFIRREIILPIRHFLYFYDLDFVEIVASQYQALRQTRRSLRELFQRDVATWSMNSTSEAVACAVSNLKVAAVGTPIAADYITGGKLLNKIEDIQDDKDNKTLFWVVGDQQNNSQNIQNCKTTMFLTIPDSAGSLFKVTKEFYRRGLNLNKIKSLSREDQSVRFLISVDGFVEDKGIYETLSFLERHFLSVDLRGSYPRSGYKLGVRDKAIDVLNSEEILRGELSANLINKDQNHVVLFTLNNKPGTLASALEVFREINLTAIDSLPSGRLNQHVFYLAFENNISLRQRELLFERLKMVSATEFEPYFLK